MASSRKRPRTEAADDNRAECPFTIVVEDGKENNPKKPPKKRKRGEEEEPQKKIYHQLSPFAPSGKFKTHETLDLTYSVEPSAKWQEMTRYNSFVLNGAKYFSEGFIFVANDSTIERQREPNGKKGPRKRSDDDWVARILEIRASDEHHVYARVYWMYWPDELPVGTTDGKKQIQGRQPYHGNYELIASNHMDIINVVSVTSMATVNHWVEENDDEVQNAMYWRQAFDCRNLELSAVEPTCNCGMPENPDKTLVGCSNESCQKWLHDDCLIHDALMRTYERLGKTKPHLPAAEPVKNEDKEEDTSKNPPLSPIETSADEPQQTIDVKSNDAPVQDNVQVKEAEETPARATSTENGSTTPVVKESGSIKAETSSSSGKKKKAKPTNGFTAREKAAKPYLGLFEGSLKMDFSPPVVEITDLRGLEEGEKTWTEGMKCLICGSQIV